ncbi:MarR family transcriptional regulator [Candidatus Nitrosoglobus terrae]|uniref:MarR family transcriptional regulator n=1 Tax=Candidatus Nitrosoglobus terrae TaxID=1630141 RepID=A0A1Q2SN70_9GAMM|nr:MarR family winged helix-turn-helix transcriptional regulator [Candidatus Nitrosoglobus terrae]BAW80549.1 MarR family transcriptional regulator [Candidatus Nitrosoglobus terrae]
MDKQKLFNLIERVGALIRVEERKAAAALSLHPAHLQVLRYLAQCNRYSNTPVAVSDYFGTTKGSISQSLLILQQHGYLQKEPDPKDQRLVHLVLTPKGKALARNMDLTSLPNKEEIFKGLDTADLQAMQHVAEQLLYNIQRVNQYQTFGQCHTCQYLRIVGRNNFRCGLTQELLESDETLKICRDHAFPPISRSSNLTINQ